jgi:HlyD family secretion protein
LGGAKVVKLLVKEREWVKAGQTIAILDNYQRKLAAVTLAEKQVKVAQANLKVVRAGAKQGEIDAQKANIKRLQAELEGEIATHQATIDRLQAQLTGEKQEQLATLNRLKSELTKAEKDFQRYQKLAADGAISESDLEARRLTLDSARERVEETEAKLNKTVQVLTKEIQETQSNHRKTVNTLNRQIQEQIATLEKVSEVRGVDVEQAQAEVEKALADLQQKKADLGLAYVTAPLDGQIIKINTYPGEKVTDDEKGVVEMGRTNKMMVVAEVYESDVKKVHIGQKATITSENNSFSGELAGKVQEIGLTVGKKDVLDTDPAADVDARIVEVKIFLNPSSSQRVSGLTYGKVFVKFSR